MTDQTTTADPRLTSLAVTVRRIRHELDRLDDSLHLLDRGARHGLDDHAVTMRDQLDDLETIIEARAAGLDGDDLVAQPPTGPHIAQP